MYPEELNVILFHTVPNDWAKQSYLQVWDFEGKTFKKKCEIFECMKMLEQFYKGGTNYKIINHRADSKCDSQSRKIK